MVKTIASLAVSFALLAGAALFEHLYIGTKFERFGAALVQLDIKAEEGSATRADADFIGLSKYAAVQDSGEAVPGTYLKELAPQALALFENSDVIISKGLGNLETLYGEGYDIFYIFMCKCAHIAKRFGYLQWQTAFVHEGK